MKYVFFIIPIVTAKICLAVIFGNVRGVVHDPDHRPVSGAQAVLRSQSSNYTQTSLTNADGEFTFSAVPIGGYGITVSQQGFASMEQLVVVISGTAPILHFQLRLGTQRETIDVAETAEAVNPESFTPTTLVTRNDIQRTPGADRSNSMTMITSFVPGASVTHDLLHVRGGHQISWLVDGVPVPNTNISNSAGPQFDPKDIDYLEVQRGSYSAEFGDRTYGVFNVVPRTGFERNNEAELIASYGSFHQSNDQLSFGSHTQRFAYYGSISGNRTDQGLATPTGNIIHDRASGLSGFGSLIYNPTSSDQLRLVSSVRRDDYQIPNGIDDETNGVRDHERERDALANFSWLHTARPGLVLTTSPFYHFTRSEFLGGPNDPDLSTQDQLTSQYAGAQIALNGVTHRHNARAGLYGFWQHTSRTFGLTATDGSGLSLRQHENPSGNLTALFLEDQFKLNSWLRLTAGVRLTHFGGAISENAASPRVGAALRLPFVNWVLRGFYGRFYQAPPLSTVGGSLLEFALNQGFGFLPLHGERNEENQFGVTVPLRGWAIDAGHFRTHSRNFFDHDALGNSNIFLPLTIGAVRIDGWEVTVRSPMLLRRGQMHLAYSKQRVEGWGGVTGGLSHFAPPPDSRFLLDHDQQHTLSIGGNANLSRRAWAAGNLYYGSGFPDNGGPVRLPQHTTFDLALGKSFGENWSVSVNAINTANRHFLLDNSLTFGGTHYFDPRQIYGQVRYRFHY